MHKCRNLCTVFRREFRSYFNAPVAYVFLIAFLILTGFLSFMVTGLYERRIADLDTFFFWHPWVYLLLVPAATMGLWAEERRGGTIELLLTLPMTLSQVVLGKFLAAWAFIGIALLLTFPVVITVGFLGSPDYGVILIGYLGSMLLAGACVAVGGFASALSRSQVIGFVVALMICLLLNLAGYPPVTDLFARWAPGLAEAVASISFMRYFEAMKRGVLDARDIVYYLSAISLALFATHLVVDNRKA